MDNKPSNVYELPKKNRQIPLHYLHGVHIGGRKVAGKAHALDERMIGNKYWMCALGRRLRISNEMRTEFLVLTGFCSIAWAVMLLVLCYSND